MKFRGTKLSRRTLALLAAAVIMLGGSGVMGTKAALTTFSPDYDATIATNTLGVELTEAVDGGSTVTIPNNGSFTLTNDAALTIGKVYNDSIGVTNSGNAPEYVRVIVRKYWVEKDQTAKTAQTLKLQPEWIELQVADGWKEVKGENDEYSIYYKSTPLGTSDEDKSAVLFTGFRINEKVLTSGKKIIVKSADGTKTEYSSDAEAAKAAGDGDVITYTYTYDGCTFNIEAEAQSVQTHNYQHAMKSVWGVNASDVL